MSREHTEALAGGVKDEPVNAKKWSWANVLAIALIVSVSSVLATAIGAGMLAATGAFGEDVSSRQLAAVKGWRNRNPKWLQRRMEWEKELELSQPETPTSSIERVSLAAHRRAGAYAPGVPTAERLNSESDEGEVAAFSWTLTPVHDARSSQGPPPALHCCCC